MIILYVSLFVAAVFALLPGFDLRRLAHIRLRHTWLVWLALADQVLVISFLPDVGQLNNAAHLASYALAALFAVLNFRYAGTWVVGVGGASNLAAILANGGTMPASRSALEASGWQAPPGHFANSAVVAEPRLSFLGDVFVTPSWLPVQSVFSVGDVVIVIGVAVFLYASCRRRPDDTTPSDLGPALDRSVELH
jgi:hypothetical protein